MKVTKILAAAALLVAAAIGSSYAAGLFPGFPTADSLTGDECIPADTNLTRGQQPATECIPPGLLTAWDGSASVRANANTCGSPAINAADGTNSTPVVTEVYVAELYVPVSGTVTGVANFNGSDATDKINVALYDSSGAVVANSALAGTQMVGTDTYQLIPFTATVDVVPGTYFIGVKFNGTTSRFNTWSVGHCATQIVTGTTFAAAFDSITPATTFVTTKGPMAGLY